MNIDKALIEKYGQLAFVSGGDFVHLPKQVISISPALDIITGGIPGGSYVVLTGDQKCGKGQPLTATIWTPDGKKQLKDMNIGDSVCNSIGGVSKIIGIYPQGIQKIYKIIFSDGSICECDENHLWEVKARQRKNSEVISTKDILGDLYYSDQPKWKIPLTKPCLFNTRTVKIDPYLLGLLLGDGGISQESVYITLTDSEIIDYINIVLEDGYSAHQTTDPITYRISRGNIGSQSENIYVTILKEYGLQGRTSHYKFVPDDYKYNTVGVRMSVLQGLMDTDGSVCKKGRIEYSTTSRRLANDVKEIVESLGGICTIVNRITSCNGKRFQSLRCRITTTDNSQLFRLTRKKQRCIHRQNIIARTIKYIEYIRDEDTVCIKLDSEDGLYLTNNFIVTHNTVTALHIAGNGQKQGREVFYFNIEGRIKERDIRGIKSLDPDKMTVVRSYRDTATGESKILTAEGYLEIAEWVIHNKPGSILILDSISMLLTDKEQTSDVEDQHRAPGAKLMANFLKRMSNIVPVNDNIVICIQHLISNTSGYGKSKVRSGGRKIAYAVDIDLEAKKFEFLRNGGAEEAPYGQKITWITGSTAYLPPGQTIESTIRYGVGIDEVTETIELGVATGFIIKGGSWYKLEFMKNHVPEESWDIKQYQAQGIDKLYNFLTESPNGQIALGLLQTELREMLQK